MERWYERKGVIVGYIVFFAVCSGFIMGYGFKAIIDDSKKQNGTPIPDNATNGDVIHGLYMPYGYVVNDNYDEVVISAEGVDMRFSKTWWNAPYQKGGKE